MIEPIHVHGKIRFFNCRSEDFISQMPDKYYDIVFSDPPYGIGMSGRAGHTKKSRKNHDKNWDNKPMPPEFFIEQKRVSKDQIIWGANHFMDNLPEPRSTTCFLIWDKRENIIPERTFADGEIAWTSFTSPVRFFRFYWDGFMQRIKEDRIHPTQKPVSLYEWKIMKFGKDWVRILDPFGGSFSSAIAAHNMDVEMDIIELDKDIFDEGYKRFLIYANQTTLLQPEKTPTTHKPSELF
jgi:site-specific DNA-methyltransferase (adenine-specific)